jgi:hypothetical protein
MEDDRRKIQQNPGPQKDTTDDEEAEKGEGMNPKQIGASMHNPVINKTPERRNEMGSVRPLVFIPGASTS